MQHDKGCHKQEKTKRSDGLAEDCGNSIANVLELPQSYAKPEQYGSGHGSVAVLVPDFAIKW